MKPLQWGRRFSTTETLESYCRTRHGPSRCFNGAVVFQRRKHAFTEFVNRLALRQLSASMGPSFFNDGNLVDVRPCNARIENWSFNGAVVFQRRKRIAPWTSGRQWGRRDGNAETSSMGPSFFNDGNAELQSQRIADRTTKYYSFNGAVVFQRRKPDSAAPAPFRHRFNGAVVFQRRKQIQPRRVGICIHERNASMGPSFFNDGNCELNLLIAFVGSEASLDVLQWGRRFSTTETGADIRTRAIVPAKKLQWGRRFSTTETPRCS